MTLPDHGPGRRPGDDTGTPSERRAGEPTARRTVLVVEDDERSLRLVTRMLRLDGFRVESAGSGPDAMAHLSAAVPDLVLMDIHLPGMSGLEVLAWMKSQPALQATPVVAMTASVMPHEQGLVYAAGFDRVVFKPVLHGELSLAVAALLDTPGA